MSEATPRNLPSGASGGCASLLLVGGTTGRTWPSARAEWLALPGAPLRPRLLPWTTSDGKQCLLSTDDAGGFRSWLADDFETSLTRC